MVDQRTRARFEEIFAEHGPAILRYATFKVGDSAEDIAAVTFLKFWERCISGEEIRNPRALLYRIAHGLVVDHYRRTATHQTAPLDEALDILDESESIENAAIQKESYAAILATLRTLKDEYREVVMLHYVEGLSVAEIAEILQETENNIRVRLHRAMAQLKEKTSI